MTATVLTVSESETPSTILPGATRSARVIKIRHAGRDYTAIASVTTTADGVVYARALDCSSRPAGSDAAPVWADLADLPDAVAGEIAGWL